MVMHHCNLNTYFQMLCPVVVTELSSYRFNDKSNEFIMEVNNCCFHRYQEGQLLTGHERRDLIGGNRSTYRLSTRPGV